MLLGTCSYTVGTLPNVRTVLRAEAAKYRGGEGAFQLPTVRNACFSPLRFKYPGLNEYFHLLCTLFLHTLH
jgi:hypothetical protein